MGHCAAHRRQCGDRRRPGRAAASEYCNCSHPTAACSSRSNPRQRSGMSALHESATPMGSSRRGFLGLAFRSGELASSRARQASSRASPGPSTDGGSRRSNPRRSDDISGSHQTAADATVRFFVRVHCERDSSAVGCDRSRLTARVGTLLGCCLLVAFVTGLASHLAQHPHWGLSLSDAAGDVVPGNRGPARRGRIGLHSAAASEVVGGLPEVVAMAAGTQPAARRRARLVTAACRVAPSSNC